MSEEYCDLCSIIILKDETICCSGCYNDLERIASELAGVRNRRNVDEYARTNGALQVWKAWRDKMLEQGRDVKEQYMELPIPEQDMELDAVIAEAVIDDFLTWYEEHNLSPEAKEYRSD